jgi:uncharacterized Zn-finger protein
MMAEDYVKFSNDRGLPEIGIGVSELKCVGASPPQDHPHIYIKIGEAGFAHCPYCGTKYVYRPWLGRLETEPAGNVFVEDIGAD